MQKKKPYFQAIPNYDTGDAPGSESSMVHRKRTPPDPDRKRAGHLFIEHSSKI